MPARRKKEPIREWIVRLTVRLQGAEIIVRARTEADARSIIDAGDFSNGIDTAGASVVDWDVERVEPNE